jgi:hypothetical protein
MKMLRRSVSNSYLCLTQLGDFEEVVRPMHFSRTRVRTDHISHAFAHSSPPLKLSCSANIMCKGIFFSFLYMQSAWDQVYISGTSFVTAFFNLIKVLTDIAKCIRSH